MKGAGTLIYILSFSLRMNKLFCSIYLFLSFSLSLFSFSLCMCVRVCVCVSACVCCVCARNLFPQYFEFSSHFKCIHSITHVFLFACASVLFLLACRICACRECFTNQILFFPISFPPSPLQKRGAVSRGHGKSQQKHASAPPPPPALYCCESSPELENDD